MFTFKKTKVTPEALAAKQLAEARLALFAAEQAAQNAMTQVEHYRKQVTYLESVAQRGGIEQWVDHRTQAIQDAGVAQITPVVPQGGYPRDEVAVVAATAPVPERVADRDDTIGLSVNGSGQRPRGGMAMG